MGQWPSLWPTLFEFQHHYTFIRAATLRKIAARQTERGTAWADKKQRGSKAGEKRGLKCKGRRGLRDTRAVIRDLLNSEWAAVTCVRICPHVTKILKTRGGWSRIGRQIVKRGQIPSHVFIFFELQCSSRGWIRTSKSSLGASLVNFYSHGRQWKRKKGWKDESEKGKGSEKTERGR